MRLLGIDGGVKTGVADHNTDDPLNTKFYEVEGGVRGFEKWWNENINPDDYDVIVAEQFNLRNQEFVADLTTVKVNEFLEAMGIKIFWQTPTEAKFKLPISVLKRGGMYPPRGQVLDGHSTDGVRHIVSYLANTAKHLPTIERLWPRD